FYKIILNFYNLLLHDNGTTVIYTLSLHDALPISVSVDADRHVRHDPCDRELRMPVYRTGRRICAWRSRCSDAASVGGLLVARLRDRKSTRLNSSHDQISYADFCLKKKMKKNEIHN